MSYGIVILPRDLNKSFFSISASACAHDRQVTFVSERMNFPIRHAGTLRVGAGLSVRMERRVGVVSITLFCRCDNRKPPVNVYTSPV